MLCSLSASAGAQQAPGDFKELYAAAEYERALEILAPLETLEALQYKALCLLALGRQDEAGATVKALVTASPTFVPSPDEAPPRFVELVASVRRVQLPVIARRLFAEGRERFAEKKSADAITRFELVLTLLADPAFQDAAAAQDLQTLAKGFIDLAQATAPLPPPTEPVRAPVVAPPTQRAPPSVTQPVPIAQEVPGVPRDAVGRLGPLLIVAVDIDAAGKVTGATLRQSSHPLYDRMVLQAARQWRYEPATLDGVPVPSSRVVTIQTPR
jgi:TonB family protein